MEPRDELAIGLAWGGRAGHHARPMVAHVIPADPAREALVDRPGADDGQVVARRQASGDVIGEPVEMLDPVRVDRRLRSAAAVPDRGIVADVPRGANVGGHVGADVLDRDIAIVPAREDRLAGVDPDKGPRAWSCVGRRREADHLAGHERAHAGPASDSSARSA
jgi:hypothetical protein